MKIVRLCSVLFLISLLPSCTSEAEKLIVGRWEAVDNAQTVEFFNDGTLLVSRGEALVGGGYKFLDETHLRLGFGDQDEAMVVEVSLSDDELIMTEEEGTEIVYHRLN